MQLQSVLLGRSDRQQSSPHQSDRSVLPFQQSPLVRLALLGLPILLSLLGLLVLRFPPRHQRQSVQSGQSGLPSQCCPSDP